MVGTFNIKTRLKIKDFQPAFVDFAGYHKFWLVRLNDEFYGWALRWSDSRQPETTLEIVSKASFPDRLKAGPIKVEILEKMTNKEIEAWGNKTHFFQTFDWTPRGCQAANSALIWEAIEGLADFRNKTVLDIGANFGYHSFRASKAGAQVTGQDRNKNVVKIARFINDRIEMQDVRFTDEFPIGQKFDYIFFFSVHHQEDPTYSRLKQRMDQLRAMAREKIFAELINPPLQGRLNETDVDRIAGGRALLRYRHEVRRIRKLYEIKTGGN